MLLLVQRCYFSVLVMKVAYVFDLLAPNMEENTLLTLTAGQQVWVEHIALSTIGGADIDSGMVTWFSGHLISAM